MFDDAYYYDVGWQDAADGEEMLDGHPEYIRGYRECLAEATERAMESALRAMYD